MIRKLGICLLLIASLFGENSFKELLEGGVTEGSLYALYYDRKHDVVGSEYTAAAVGGSLAYTSRKEAGIFVSAKLRSTNLTGAKNNPELSRLVGTDQKSVDALSEAYLGLVDGNHLLRIGRQYLDTPLLNGDTTRVVPYTYNGVQYQWSGSDKSRAVLGKVHEVKAFDSRFFEAVSDSGSLDDGIWYLGLEDRRISGLGYIFYYYQAKQLFDTLFVEIDDSYDLDGVQIFSGIQYIKTYENGEGENIDPSREEGGGDVALAALRLGFKAGTYGLIVAHSQNSGRDGLGRAYGGMAELFTTTMITDGIHRGSPKTTSLRLKYDWTPETSTRLIYNVTEYGVDAHDKVPASATNDYKSFYADLQYEMPGDALVYFQYEQIDKELEKTDLNEFRFSFVQWF